MTTGDVKVSVYAGSQGNFTATACITRIADDLISVEATSKPSHNKPATVHVVQAYVTISQMDGDVIASIKGVIPARPYQRIQQVLGKWQEGEGCNPVELFVTLARLAAEGLSDPVHLYDRRADNHLPPVAWDVLGQAVQQILEEGGNHE